MDVRTLMRRSAGVLRRPGRGGPRRSHPDLRRSVVPGAADGERLDQARARVGRPGRGAGGQHTRVAGLPCRHCRGQPRPGSAVRARPAPGARQQHGRDGLPSTGDHRKVPTRRRGPARGAARNWNTSWCATPVTRTGWPATPTPTRTRSSSRTKSRSSGTPAAPPARPRESRTPTAPGCAVYGTGHTTYRRSRWATPACTSAPSRTALDTCTFPCGC